MTVKFYDTNALLNLQEKAFEEKFWIAIQTLNEIENIKTSAHKDQEIKYKARKLAHLLDENADKYEVSYEHLVDGNDWHLPTTPDANICYNAFRVSAYLPVKENEKQKILFVTDDICCRLIAKNVFHLEVCGTGNRYEEYTGYKEVSLGDDEMASFYENLAVNSFDCLINQYLIIKNSAGEAVDKFRWTGENFVPLKKVNLCTNAFGDVKPYKNDVYQQLLLDSFAQNKITAVTGSAGTGKSFLSLAYLLKQLELGKISKIIVFCNTVATHNAARLGFLPGTRNEKLLESSIGNILSSKLGGIYEVERLINEGRLLILPMCDMRGYDTTGMKAGIYITEAQNMDIELMRLALQRIGEDCICIIDGDCDAQVDMADFAGSNNGMRRMSEIFRGQDFYGEVKLNNIYRSRIAALAQKM